MRQSWIVLKRSRAFQILLNFMLALVWLVTFAILTRVGKLRPEVMLVATSVAVLVAYAVVFLMFRLILSSFLSGRPDLALNRRLRVNSEGIAEQTEVGRVELGWQAIETVVFDPRSLLLAVHGGDGIYVPRSAFQSEEEFLRTYRSLVALHLSSRGYQAAG